MSIVDDFAAISGRLAEIEKIPAKEAEPACGGYVAPCLPEIRMAKPVVWTPEHGYGSADTAPSELCWKPFKLKEAELEFIAQRTFVAPDTDCAWRS